MKFRSIALAAGLTVSLFAIQNPARAENSALVTECLQLQKLTNDLFAVQEQANSKVIGMLYEHNIYGRDSMSYVMSGLETLNNRVRTRFAALCVNISKDQAEIKSTSKTK